MNKRSHSLQSRWLTAVLGFSLVLLCLLAPGHLTQAAYSQDLEAPGTAADPTALEQTPCANPLPPGTKVKIVGDDEILLSFRQASESKYLANQFIDNPVGSTLLTASSVQFLDNKTLDPYAPNWVVNSSGDLDGDGYAELLTAARNYYSQLSVLDNVYNSSIVSEWLNSASPFAGSTVSWIDVAAGNLDRLSNPSTELDEDEIVVAFKDNNSDIHVVLLDGEDYPLLGGWIGNVDNTLMSQWTKSDLERGTVNHVTVATADLDGDGFDDEIVVAYKDSGSDLQVEILEYNGTATLQELWRIDSRDNGRDNVAVDGSGAYSNKWPIDITTGDLDGDMMDEVVLAFRIDNALNGNIQLWALDVTNPTNWTIDSSVWRNHPVPSATRSKAATAVSVSAADLDGDGYDEIALGYNISQTDTCNSMGQSYACESRWRQQLVTYEYTPFSAPEYMSCPAGSPLHGCFRQRSGTWTSTTNYGQDESVEGLVMIATGDLDQNTRDEIALAHYKWENDNIEVISFDAEDSLTIRSTLETELGSNRPTGFWIAMGDRDNDSRYALYDDECYVKTEAQVVSAIYAPPHWPEEHIAANEHHASASFDAQIEQASGTSTEVSTSIGASVTVGPSFHEIGASFTYGWEKEAFAEKSQTKLTEDGLKYSTCSPLFCGEEAYFGAVQIVETKFNCFGYYEPEGGDMEVCLPTYSRKLPYPQDWWYTTGYETYPESWIPIGHNLAQGRSASQSSEDSYAPGPASRAVDGDANGTFSSGHVSHTGLEYSPWWQVDLGGVQWLGAVQIWNRTDLGLTANLQDFYVLVSEEPFPADATLATLLADPEIWNTFIAGKSGRPTVIPVDHHGRYVRVQRPIAKYIHLDIAELEVFGMPGAVDQWPKAQPTSPDSDTLSLTWRDPNLPAQQLVQTVPGQLLVVDFDKTSVAASTTSQESTIGFGKEYESITGGATAQETSVGMEIKWIEGEVSTTTSQKTSYALSWGNKVGFFGEVAGLPSETNPPTMVDYQYDFSQYAWVQRATSAGGVKHAFMVGGYWVPQIGPFAGLGAPPPPVTDGPAATPATPLINSASHPNPDNWVDSASASFTWKQPAGDSTAISGYTWLLDQTADTIPNEVNRGLVTVKSFDALADGIWYLHVRAVSTGGQWSETAHRAVRVDVTPPEITLNLDPGQPSGDNGWYITPVTVAVDAADGDGAGVAKVEVSSDGVTWQPYAAPLQFTEDTAGTTVYARASDAAGHVAEPAMTTFKIDQTAPDSHINGGAGPGTWIAEIIADEQGNEELVLAGSFADDLSGRSGFSLGYDGLDWIGPSKIGSWYPIPDQPQIEVNWVFTATHEIGAGYHIFMGQAQDVAGNQEEAYEIARVLWLPKASPDIAGSSVATSAAAIRPGEQVAFALVARNDGDQEAYVTVSNKLPEGLSPVLDVLPADVEYDAATQTLTWPDHLLWPGEHVQHIFLAEAEAALPVMTLENEATFHAFWPNTDLLPPAERQPFLDREQTVIKTTVITVDPALPADSDHTRPWAILTLGTNATTTGPQVDLTVVAVDDGRWMYLREWAPDPQTGAWIVMQDSGWLPYKRTTSWTLSEGQGVKYLGVWVADRSGNVSNLSEHALAFVNRLDSSQALADGQRIQYRSLLDEGMAFTGALKTISGDPDVYLWQPRNAFGPDRYRTATVEPGQLEDLGYGIVQRSGRYLLEVHAVGASEYELALNGSGFLPSMARQTLTEKPQPAHPLLVGDPLSANQVGPLVSLEHRTYLPLTARN